jgi:predicted ArsR family transcriptional regulator
MSTRGPDPKVTDSELYQAIDQTDEPFATANQISDAVGLSSFRVRQRMEKLAEEGKIESSRLGEGPYIYWRSGSFEHSDSES